MPEKRSRTEFQGDDSGDSRLKKDHRRESRREEGGRRESRPEELPYDKDAFRITRALDEMGVENISDTVNESLKKCFDHVRKKKGKDYLNIFQEQFYRLAHPRGEGNLSLIVRKVLKEYYFDELFMRGELLDGEGSLNTRKLWIDRDGERRGKEMASQMTIISSIFKNSDLSRSFFEFVEQKIERWKGEGRDSKFGENLVSSVITSKDELIKSPLMNAKLNNNKILQPVLDLINRYVLDDKKIDLIVTILTEQDSYGENILSRSVQPTENRAESIEEIFDGIDRVIPDVEGKKNLVKRLLINDCKSPILNSCALFKNISAMKEVFEIIKKFVHRDEVGEFVEELLQLKNAKGLTAIDSAFGKLFQRDSSQRDSFAAENYLREFVATVGSFFPNEYRKDQMDNFREKIGLPKKEGADLRTERLKGMLPYGMGSALVNRKPPSTAVSAPTSLSSGSNQLGGGR